ncbi:MAG: zf-HC2 domain-containing protein [Deltaproteobacteria bacterium]|nr:zf-HC2 domain-containing protein [Deltaproteobacteria bacterium]
MRCHRIQKRLAVYQDGEVSGKERERISTHLEGCPACRSAYAELEQAWQSLEKIPEIQASAGFERRLSERINAVPEPRSRWRFLWGSWVYRAYPAPAMAAVLLLVGTVLGGYLGNALVSGFLSAPAQEQASRTGADIVSFSVFSAVPPGTLGNGYLRMAHFTEEYRK